MPVVTSAVAFVFVAFVFAFFYLKALNSNGDWRIHINPSQGYGIATLACVLGATALFEVGRRALAREGLNLVVASHYHSSRDVPDRSAD